MKKFLIVLGSIFLAMVVLGGIGIAFVTVRGSAFDKESKAYADSAIPAIVTTWSEKELLDRASLEFITRLSLTNAEAHLSLTNSTKNRLKPLDPLTNNSDTNP
jgi:hypothetical protein